MGQKLSDGLVREIYGGRGRERLLIYRRVDGSFYFEEERLVYFDVPALDVWVSSGPAMAGFYDTQETAEREGRASVGWSVAGASPGAA